LNSFSGVTIGEKINDSSLVLSFRHPLTQLKAFGCRFRTGFTIFRHFHKYPEKYESNSCRYLNTEQTRAG